MSSSPSLFTILHATLDSIPGGFRGYLATIWASDGSRGLTQALVECRLREGRQNRVCLDLAGPEPITRGITADVHTAWRWARAEPRGANGQEEGSARAQGGPWGGAELGKSVLSSIGPGEANPARHRVRAKVFGSYR